MSSSQFATSQLAARRKFADQVGPGNNFAVQTTRNTIQEAIAPLDTIKKVEPENKNSKPAIVIE